MPVNRFDQPMGQRYVSTYVPLPLEEIGSLAKQYQDQHKVGQALPQQLDVLGQAIKAAPVDFENKENLIKEYKGKLSGIVNSARPEDFAKPEYQQQITGVLNQFKNDPRLNAIANNKEVFDKVYTPYLSSKESKKDLVLTNIMDQDNPVANYKAHPTGYKQLKPGESLAPLDYVQHEDALKGAKTIMDDIKIDGTPLSSISTWKRDGNYFIDQDGHRKEITKDKVMNLAKSNVGNYAENSEGRFRFKTLLNQVGLDPHMSYTEFKYNESISPKIKKAVEEELANDLYNYGSKQIFKDTDISYDLKNNVLAQHAAKKQIDETITPGLLQSIEGAPISLVSPEFKQLFTEGIINDKGEINWQELSKPSIKPASKESQERIAQMGGWLMIDMSEDSNNKGVNMTSINKLVNVANQAAKILGVPANQVNSNTIPQILKDYNQFMSVKGYMGNQYTGADKDIITKQVANDPTNYEFLDGKLQVSDNAQETKKKIFNTTKNKFTVDTRVNIDGKSYLQGTVTNKETGESEQFYIRPRTKEFNQHFDNVAKVAQDLQGYYTGKSKPKTSYDPAFGKQQVISETSTNGGKSIIMVYKDPNDPNGVEQVVKYDIEYVPGEVKGEYNTKLSNRQILGNSFKEFQQGEHYNYGFTTEGRKMYENIAPNKIKYEENVGEE